MRSTSAALLAGVLVCGLSTGLLSGCSQGPAATPAHPASSVSPSSATPGTPTPAPTPPSSAPPSSPPASSPPAGTVPPGWLGTRVLPTTASGYGETLPTPSSLRRRRFTLPDTVAMLPGRGFASRVTSPAPTDVIARSTWVPGCPVAASDLAWVRLAFWGFDHTRHTGELLVNAAVADDVVRAFRDLYRARFPIEEMRITTRAELDAPPTGDGNDTSAFACRPKAGQTSGFSEHAYGRAIDVNPFQNPYVNGPLVLPELASSYVARDDVRPGMIAPGDAVVRAFARIGWGWGGDWRTLKDLQHFSQNDH